MVLKKPFGLLATNFGKNARKKTFNNRFIETFAIFMAAYFIGFFSARSFENGIIARASSVKIQMVYVMYSTLISDKPAKVCRNNNAKTKNPKLDQNNETVEVEMTFFLLSSEL